MRESRLRGVAHPHGYVIVEKTGEAGEIADQLDPREEAGD